MCKYPEVKVKLVGEDGNAYSIMGRAQAALRRVCRNHKDMDFNTIKGEYIKEATAGDYNHLLVTTMEWFDCDSEPEEDR